MCFSPAFLSCFPRPGRCRPAPPFPRGKGRYRGWFPKPASRRRSPTAQRQWPSYGWSGPGSRRSSAGLPPSRRHPSAHSAGPPGCSFPRRRLFSNRPPRPPGRPSGPGGRISAPAPAAGPARSPPGRLPAKARRRYPPPGP